MLPSPFSPLPSPLSLLPSSSPLFPLSSPLSSLPLPSSSPLFPLSSPLSPLLSPSPLSLSPLTSPPPLSPLLSPSPLSLSPLPSPPEVKREKGLRASDYMTYMSILHILFLAASLDFIYMSSYSTVALGHDPYSSRITPDTSFPFGNSRVSSVYVSIYMYVI